LDLGEHKSLRPLAGYSMRKEKAGESKALNPLISSSKESLLGIPSVRASELRTGTTTVDLESGIFKGGGACALGAMLRVQRIDNIAEDYLAP